MKIYFVKRGDQYWNDTAEDLGAWSFTQHRDYAKCFFYKGDAFSKLENVIQNGREWTYTYRDNPEFLKKESYKIVSLKGPAALAYLIQRLDSRLEAVETTLKEHKL